MLSNTSKKAWLIANVVNVLEKKQMQKEANKLALVSKEVMIEVGKKQFISTSGQPIHPLNALLLVSSADHNMMRRICVSYAIRHNNFEHLRHVCHSITGDDFDMKVFMSMYCDNMKGRLALARALVGGDNIPKYTFHIVYKFFVKKSDEQASSFLTTKNRKKPLGGEIAVHRFICFPDLISSLFFFQRWMAAQIRASSSSATCLMECGPPDDSVSRKWIIDVDAALQDLKTMGFLEDPSVCSEQDRINLKSAIIRLGSSISIFLQSIGFTRTPCYFALKSRHQPLHGSQGFKKLSWHVTLMAFAPYSEWRRAMQLTESKGYPPHIRSLIHENKMQSAENEPKGLELMKTNDPWIAALLTDSHILANSKGQYLQTLNSEKVEAGVPASGRRFVFEGVYNSKGEPVVVASAESADDAWSLSTLLAYSSTSLAMQDPWSILASTSFKKTAMIEDVEEDDETKKRKRSKSVKSSTEIKRGKTNNNDQQQQKKKEKQPQEEVTLLNRWELLPPSEAVWMRGLLEIPGASLLTLLPCIKDEKIMPSEVFNIVNSGRGKIIFYANVVHVTLCPRFLVNGNLIHRHHNDSAVAICITEKTFGDNEQHRLFVRCFSEKCLHHCRKTPKKQIPSKWEEYNPSHYTRYRRLLMSEEKGEASRSSSAAGHDAQKKNQEEERKALWEL